MNRHYTSIEQSKRLLELGLNPKTADMCYMYAKFDGESEPQYFASLSKAKTNDISCWSEGALLDLIPSKIYGPVPKDHPTELMICKSDGKVNVMYFDWTGIQHGPDFNDDNYIDALYNCTVWLLENNYIKTEQI